MSSRAFWINRLPAGAYRAFMDANFRRSGRMIYQPTCDACRACRQLRVVVDEFAASASQRRCGRKNAELRVTFARPVLTDEKIDLYGKYLHHWHGRPDEGGANNLGPFLYDSPTDTLEFEYRAPKTDALLAVGICDVSPTSLSSVYFYFDPAHASRGLGTFGALHEIAFARERGIPYYYLGYWIKDCARMNYKARFLPHDVLKAGGGWERVECKSQGGE